MFLSRDLGNFVRAPINFVSHSRKVPNSRFLTQTVCSARFFLANGGKWFPRHPDVLPFCGYCLLTSFTKYDRYRDTERNTCLYMKNIWFKLRFFFSCLTPVVLETCFFFVPGFVVTHFLSNTTRAPASDGAFCYWHVSHFDLRWQT